jgi:hypothetical protein
MDVVYQAANLIDAHLVRIALEQARIPAFVLGESLVGGIGELPACGLIAVCVPPSCAAVARAVVGGHAAGVRRGNRGAGPDSMAARHPSRLTMHAYRAR